MGWSASWLFDYESFLAESTLAAFMRPITDRWVMAGPLFQPFRGVLFGWIFYLLREPFLHHRRGWLSMWFVLLVLGTVNTFGPALGSIEGLVYTKLPLRDQLRGLPEVVVQSLLLSVSVFYWVRQPETRWLTWLFWVAFVVCVSLPLLGLLATGHGA